METQIDNQLLQIDVLSDATVSYAAYQNNIPLVREILVTNNSDEIVRNLTIRITTSPAFSDPLVLSLGNLNPKENKITSVIDIELHHEYLVNQTEAERGYLNIEAVSNSETVYYSRKALELLAYDQWAGTRSLPQLLAAFSLPNDSVVEKLMFKAAELLRAIGNGTLMNGYQSKNRDDVWFQVSALYSAIAEEHIHYAEAPASFGSDGQKIRTPERILSKGIATCLDTTMLMSSCLEQAGLNPLVLVKNGHAWIGCWLTNTTLPTAVYDDCQDIRKKVATGELIVFETTFLTRHPVQSLKEAATAGLKHLQDDVEFQMAIDVKACRLEQIRPLPSKDSVLQNSGRLFEKSFLAIDTPPELPPLDAVTFVSSDSFFDNSQGRLSQWKAKLLDLTLRNRQINFKDNKLTLRLYVPYPAKFEDAISKGEEWKLRPAIKLMEGDDPRSAAIAYKRLGEEPLKLMALQAAEQKELIALADPVTLDGKLYNIFSATKLGLEEGGANTLFLALGFLNWTEDLRAEQKYTAPILFVPVTLTRKSVKSGYLIKRHDDETIVNPTLLQLMKEKFGLSVSGLDPLPADENGVDVAKIWQIFRLITNELPKWEVTEDVCLGIFSFTKYLMWKDLQDRTNHLRKNRIVNHLIEHPHEPLSISTDISIRGDLEHRHDTADLLTPLLADSSQLNAISRASQGYDFAIEGPPGTGKSQTITNLIAHTLGQGKTVLFVSEKMAALEVVRKRLSAIGLDPFCLELHSAKAKKTEVLEQFRLALNATSNFSKEQWSDEAARLSSLRKELNGMVMALHKKAANGLSAWDAINLVLSYPNTKNVDFSWFSSEVHSKEDVLKIFDIAESIALLGTELPGIVGLQLEGIQQLEWTNEWEDRLIRSIRHQLEICDSLQSSVETVLATFNLRADVLDHNQMLQISKFMNLLLEGASMRPTIIRHIDNEVAFTTLNLLRDWSKRRAEQWKLMSADFRAEVCTLQASDLRANWNVAITTWWPKRVFARRRVLRNLIPYTRSQSVYAAAKFPDFLISLESLNEIDTFLNQHATEGRVLLENEYKGWETDWGQVATYEVWVKSFRLELSKFLDHLNLPDNAAQRASVIGTMSARQFALTEGGKLRNDIEFFVRSVNQFEVGLKEIGHLLANTDFQAVTVKTSLKSLTRMLNSWIDNRKYLRAWIRWQNLRREALNLGLAPAIDLMESGRIQLGELSQVVESNYYNWWLKKRIDELPPLRDFSSADKSQKILKFQIADEKYQRLTEQYIAATLSEKVPKEPKEQKPSVEMALLLRELKKRRAHLPVRKLIQQISPIITKLKPCLLMSPLSVAQYLSPDAFFDLIVFDEASQIPVWDAIGAIARGKQLVVVGDPKQLPPTNFFSSGGDDGSENESNGIVKDLESILDECIGAGMPTLRLEWHYRSKHEKLISFSNEKYYESSLITFPSNKTADASVTVTKVDGVYDRGGTRTNLVEAQAVVQYIAQHFLNESARNLSIGVITFNISQKALIDKLLDEQMVKIPELERRIAEHTVDKLFVKNLENVQGDERDIVLFSIGFGRDKLGKLPMNFGPLSKEGGQRRLNVAITRARHAIKIFSSINPEDIDLTRTNSSGVRDLRHYLEFASRKQSIDMNSTEESKSLQSMIERQIVTRLQKAGWKIHSNVGYSAYKIGIAVVHPKKSDEYLLAVELDNKDYANVPTVRDRDRLRESVLSGLGWKVHKVWAFDWLSDPEEEIRKIQQKLHQLMH